MINYDIYQLKDDPSLHSIRFANTKFMNTHNIPIDAGNYDKVYSGTVDNESAAGKKSTDEVLETISKDSDNLILSLGARVDAEGTITPDGEFQHYFSIKNVDNLQTFIIAYNGNIAVV